MQLRELNYPNLVFGGDSSKWDDIDSTPQYPDFQKAYELGWKYNYLKATQGIWVDQDYKINWANSRKTPLKLGVYHFLQWDLDPKRQAEFFWDTVKHDPGELPLICDFEWWRTTPSNAMDILYNFLERLKQLCGGKRIGIYTAKSFWLENGSNAEYWKQYDLWIAHYQLTPPQPFGPWTEWFMWQYTGHGDGLYYGMESKDVDLDYMNKDLYEKYTGETIPEQPEENNMDWTKNAIGFYTKTDEGAAWDNNEFDFVVGYAGGSNWIERGPNDWVYESNSRLKPIELKARAKGKLFFALWDFDVSAYSLNQIDARDGAWPNEKSDYPLQALIDALAPRDIDGIIIRVLNNKNRLGGKEMQSYVSYAASKFVSRVNTWLYTTKGLNKWVFVLSNDDFMKIDGKEQNFYTWTKNWYLGIEQEAVRPLALGAWPQEADKIKSLPVSLGWKLWYHYNASTLDMMMWNGTDADMRAFLEIGNPQPPEEPDDPDEPQDLTELKAKVAALETEVSALQLKADVYETKIARLEDVLVSLRNHLYGWVNG